jgi:hypothetical protein
MKKNNGAKYNFSNWYELYQLPLKPLNRTLLLRNPCCMGPAVRDLRGARSIGCFYVTISTLILVLLRERSQFFSPREDVIADRCLLERMNVCFAFCFVSAKVAANGSQLTRNLVSSNNKKQTLEIPTRPCPTRVLSR